MAATILPPRLHQKGTSLIEVLVAVLILSIGLLGFAGLQTQAMQQSYDSLQRSRASVLAEDLFDRMRANANYARSNSGYEIGAGASIPSSPGCDTGICSASNIARYDLNRWLTQLQQTLPGATADISRQQGHYRLVIYLSENSRGSPVAFEFVSPL